MKWLPSGIDGLSVYDVAVGCHLTGIPYGFKGKSRYYLVHLNSRVWSEEGWTSPVSGWKTKTKLYLDEKISSLFEGSEGSNESELFRVWVPGTKVEYFAIKNEDLFEKLTFEEAWFRSSTLSFVICPSDAYGIRKQRKTGIKFKKNKPRVDRFFEINNRFEMKRSSDFIEDTSQFPLEEYKQKENIDNLHVGQRKLLDSEIEFLTKIEQIPGNRGVPKVVFYAGAASGDHIPFLEDMFPNFTFVLFDPNSFSIRPSKRVTIVKDFFYGTEFEEFGLDVYFISDIRTTPSSSENEDDRRVKLDAEVLTNNKLQNCWISNKRVIASMLKFRLPYDDGASMNPKGVSLPQCWAPKSSTESRLTSWYRDAPCGEQKVDRGLVPYSHRTKEENMAFFNNKYRCQTFYNIHPVFGANYDVLKESKVLRNYLSLFYSNVSDQMVLDWIAAIDKFIPRTNAQIASMIAKPKSKRRK